MKEKIPVVLYQGIFIYLYIFFGSRTLSLQQFIAFLSQEFLRQAVKLGWLFTRFNHKDLIDFTVCRLVEIKSLSSTF